MPRRPARPPDRPKRTSRQLRAEIEAFSNAIRITRNDFIAAVTIRMGQLRTGSNRLKAQVISAFGKDSREAVKLSTAGAQAQRTIAGVAGEMSRLGIASKFELDRQNEPLPGEVGCKVGTVGPGQEFSQSG